MIYLRHEVTQEIINVECDELGLICVGEFYNYWGEIYKVILINT